MTAPLGSELNLETTARHSVRHAGLLMAQQALHVLAAGLFAVLVPRLMGPTMFGRYALLTSVAMWFALLSGLGAVSLITRTVPQFLAAGDTAALRKLFTNLLALRGATGLFTATAYAAVVTVALGVSDWVSVLLIAGAVCCRTVANVCFALFLGLNQAARWGAGDLLRRWLTLVLVITGLLLAGLRGACAGFFTANLAVLLIGLMQAWTFLRWTDLDLGRRYLAPFLRIGTAFAAGNLLLALAQRSGETIVRITTGDFAEVGYYGAAYSIYLTIAHALWQLAIAFAPFLVARLHADQAPVVVSWLERLLKWMVIVAAPIAAGTLSLGGALVPLLLGPAYQPVAVNLIPLTLALITLSVNSVGRLAALALDRPGLSAAAAALELAAFWALGLVLAPHWGSLGVCVAALAGSAVYSLSITWRLHRELAYSLRVPLQAGLLASTFLPLIWVRSTLAIDVGLFVGAAALYVWLLWRFRIVGIGEIAEVRRLAGIARRG